MFRLTTVLAIALFALTGCASLAKPNVRSSLIEAGVRPSVADCMADRMTDRLSVQQLQKLKRVKARPGEKKNDLSAAEIVQRVRRVDDTEVVTVTASAGAICSVTS